MSNRLPVFDVFRNSFRYMLEHYRILSLFCIFSFLGIYMLGGFNLADNLLGGAFYLLYTYLFYFIFVRVYFNRQKLFSKPEFINALVRIIRQPHAVGNGGFVLSLAVESAGNLSSHP